MVNAGRVACIFTPFALTIAALICVVLVFISGSIDGNRTLDDLYFMKIDLSNLTLTNSANLIGASDANSTAILSGALQAAKEALHIKDHYTIYLRGYCSWDDGNNVYAQCSSPKTYFWFNPLEIWGLDANNTGASIEQMLPKEVRDGLQAYEKVSYAMCTVYIIALATAAGTLVIGISAIFSRWGSFATTFFAAAAGIFLLAGSIIATAMFGVLKGVLNKEFESEFGITSTYGNRAFVVTWVGTAFAVGGAFFWLLSVCCCSGRSPYNPGSKDARRTRAEKTPYTYERVGSPYLGPQGQQSMPLQNFGGQAHPGYHSGPATQRQTAYEPFRAQV